MLSNPNIPGSFKYLYSYGDDWSGSFYNTNGGKAVFGVNQPSTGFANLYQLMMGFDPSKVSSYYGASDKPQVDGLFGLMLIRGF